MSKAQKAKRKVFKIVKGGPFGLFESPVCCKISKKLKEGPLETKKTEKTIVSNVQLRSFHST